MCDTLGCLPLFGSTNLTYTHKQNTFKQGQGMPGQSLASVVICSTQKTWRKPVYSTSPSSSSTSRCPWKVSHKRTDRESQKNVFGLWSVASNSGGKKPNSAKRGRSSGCGVPRRTARRALRPVRTKKVTWLLPTLTHRGRLGLLARCCRYDPTLWSAKARSADMSAKAVPKH